MTDKAGIGMSMSMMNPQVWVEQQRAIIKMEYKKERLKMENEIIEEMTRRTQHQELEAERYKLHHLEEFQRKKEIRMREEMEYHSKVGK